MSKLSANVDDLNLASQKLSLVVPDLNLIKTELNGILAAVNTDWEGDAANTYKTFIRNYLNEINSVQTCVNELKEYSTSVAVQMRELDLLLNILSFFGIS